MAVCLGLKGFLFFSGGRCRKTGHLFCLSCVCGWLLGWPTALNNGVNHSHEICAKRKDGKAKQKTYTPGFSLGRVGHNNENTKHKIAQVGGEWIFQGLRCFTLCNCSLFARIYEPALSQKPDVTTRETYKYSYCPLLYILFFFFLPNKTQKKKKQ